MPAEDVIHILALDDQPATLQAYRWVFSSQEVWSDAAGSGPRAEPDGEGSRFALTTTERAEDAVAAVAAARAEGRPFTVAFVNPQLAGPVEGVSPAAALRAEDPDINLVLVAQPADLHPDRIGAPVPPIEKLLYFPTPFQPHVLRHLATTLAAKWLAEHQIQHSHRVLERQVVARTRELAALNEQLSLDIARRQAVEAALVASEERYALAARAANDVLWDWDLLAERLYFSERWYEMLGLDPREALAGTESWFGRVHPEDRQPLRLAIQEHFETGGEHFEYEHRLRPADGAYRWVLCRGLLVRRADGVPARFVGSMSDITARKDAEARLVHDALHDSLTGLPNRALFLERLAHAIQVCRRNPGMRSALVFLDLDGFKLVNDSMGHWAGDELLQAVAGRIERCLRGTDLLARFGMEQALARFGGDEFTILLVGIREQEDALRVVRRILQELARPFRFRGQEVYTSASAGIAIVDETCDDPAKVLRNADIAMYRAKEAGRSTFCLFDDAMHARAVQRLELETALRQAIERGTLHLHYQPVVALDSGRIRGFEALVRWHHPTLGGVGPGEFVPLAEETGLINPLGAWVLREACVQAAAWRHAFPGQDLFMAVNISGRQLTQQDLASQVRACLEETRLPPSHLKLEITESVLMENDAGAREMLDQIHALGVALHMDDFGTGYSSLSYLHRFPFEAIKIDRSFVVGMSESRERQQVTDAIVKLAHALGMETTAEGVETAEQVAWLRERRCQSAQGYLFSRPVEPALARRLIERAPRWVA